MYLMALGNTDYIIATIFFALIVVTAYLFRRKQQTAAKFLFGDDDLPISQVGNKSLGVGLIEMVAAGAVGAIFGISGLYYAFVILVASYIILHYISRAIYPYSIYEYLSQKVGGKFSAFYAILCVLLLLMWTSFTVVLVSKLFLSLLGWNFVNSTFALMLVTLICLELGGYIGLRYSQKLWILIISVTFILALIFAFNSGFTINKGIETLQQLAISQDKVKDWYTGLHFSFHFENIVGAAISIIIAIPLITAIKVKQRSTGIIFTTVKLVLFGIMVISGILAIATPAKSIAGSEKNSKIITYQAQLPDGQVGYVIKSVEANGRVDSVVPGIVPPLLNDKTSLVEAGQYDYKLVNLVMLRHYLPQPILVLLVLTIMAAFMYTISQYLLSIAKIVTLDICPPFSLFKGYGEEGKLWCSRMSVIFAGGISLFGGYFLQQSFHLVPIMNIVFSFAGVLMLTLLVITVVYGKK